MKASFKKQNRDFEILIIWVEIKSNLIRIVEDRGKILQSDFSFVCVELGSYRERTVTERIIMLPKIMIWTIRTVLVMKYEAFSG